MPLPKLPMKPADIVCETEKTDTEIVSNVPDITSVSVTAGDEQSSDFSPVSANLSKSRTKAIRQRQAAESSVIKIFVLDTNVLLHDPTSLFRFKEHDVYIPMTTLEELDNNKSGLSDIARNARQVSRTLDALISDIQENSLLQQGIPLNKTGNIEAKGRLYFQTDDTLTAVAFDKTKADNLILSIVAELSQKTPDRLVVLVSKDINMRLKARALGLSAEDYFNDQVLEDSDLLYTGISQLSQDFWNGSCQNLQTKAEKDAQGITQTVYTLQSPLASSLHLNEFIHIPENGDRSFNARVTAIQDDAISIKTIQDYQKERKNVWGITARNIEQNFALNLLLDPSIDFVTLVGPAGTGKTLLALAAGLTQVFENQFYNEVIVTRPTIPVGEDIGYLPGTEEEKMTPWMGALDDNLEVLAAGNNSGTWEQNTAKDLIQSRISIKSMSFMRGRTFIKKFLIIDEAQNLTPKQMKTLITRAGIGTKIVCLGNLAQIDTPYLTEGSSGLTYVVDRFKNWEHSGHIILAKGERSRLADYASEAL